MSVLEIDASCLDRVQKILANVPGGAQKATKSALKRAGQSAKTKAGQYAAAQYTINKGTFMSHVNDKMETTSNTMTLSYTGAPLPMIMFKTKATNHGVKAQILRSGSSGQPLPHAFIPKKKGGSVFERVGSSRTPLQAIYSPGTSTMMANEEVVEQMDKTIVETFEKRIEHEIMRLLTQG